MFDKFSRTSNDEGLYFYEEDIIFDDHLYYGNQSVEIVSNYYNQGLGILFMLNPNQPLEKQNAYYLIRADARTVSLFYCVAGKMTRLEQKSFFVDIPCNNLKMVVSYYNGKFIVTINEHTIMQKTIIYKFNVFHVALYSQKGNTIKQIALYGDAPAHWRINMQGTDGGRIQFAKHSIFLADCKRSAEILQDSVFLKKGVYYLKYNCTGDLAPYVFLQEDDQILDEAKNILTSKSSFELFEDNYIILKFSGKEGELNSVQITDDNDGIYIPSYNEAGSQESSFIKLYTEGVKYVKGAVHLLRYLDTSILLEEKEYGYLDLPEDEKVFKILLDAQDFNKEGYFTFLIDLPNQTFTLYEDDMPCLSAYIHSNEFNLFKDIRCTILSIIVTLDSDEEITYPVSTTYSEYVKAPIYSPIIVTDYNKQPLELVSDYRIVNNRYLFTPTKREYFKPAAVLILNKSTDFILNVYGIPDGKYYDKANFYKGLKEDIHDISTYCPDYVPLTYNFVNGSNQVIINEYELMQEIVIDYVLPNSYSINFHSDKFLYEVQLTTKDYYLYYESNPNQYCATPFKLSNEQGFIYNRLTQFEQSLDATKNTYIVLREGGI